MQTDAGHGVFDTIATVAGALATVSVAFFAGVQIWREKKRSAAQCAAAVARTSAIGYSLRGRIRSWLGMSGDKDDNSEKWLRAAQRGQTLEAEFQGGVEELREMMSLLADVPEATAKGIRNAYVLYLEGIRRLSEYAIQSRPMGIEVWDWVELKNAAVADLADCVSQLEDGVIEPALLNSEGVLARKRSTENPWHQLSEGVAKMLEEESDKDDSDPQPA